MHSNFVSKPTIVYRGKTKRSKESRKVKCREIEIFDFVLKPAFMYKVSTRTEEKSWIDGRSDVAQTLSVTLSAAEGSPR